MERQLAVLETEVKHLKEEVRHLRADGKERREAQVADTAKMLGEITKLRLELEGGRGFARGIKFTVGLIWALVGGAVATFLGRLFS